MRPFYSDRVVPLVHNDHRVVFGKDVEILRPCGVNFLGLSVVVVVRAFVDGAPFLLQE